MQECRDLSLGRICHDGDRGRDAYSGAKSKGFSWVIFVA
jgi:hypothetical protein